MERAVKKRIRAVQYGVGPIGAAIVRLMREKSSIEIIGAIDSDPAKAGRDLGDAVEGPDAPWGVPITDDAAAMLGESPDIVIHSTSSYLPNVMDQLIECLAAILMAPVLYWLASRRPRPGVLFGVLLGYAAATRSILSTFK